MTSAPRARAMRARGFLLGPLAAGLLLIVAGLTVTPGAVAAPAPAVGARDWRVLFAQAAERGRGVDAVSLANGDILPPSVRVRVGAQGIVQLLGGDLHLAVVGPAEVELTLGGAARRVVRIRSAAALQLSGLGGALRLGDLDVRLAGGGATVLYQGRWLYVRRGSITVPAAHLLLPASAPTSTPSTAPTSVPSSAPSTPSTPLTAPRTVSTISPAPRLQAGQALRLDSLLVSPVRAPAAAVAAVSRYGHPRRYRPATKIALKDEVRRVRRWSEARQQTAREMAACGCTEGSGPGRGNQSSGPNTALMLEGRNARLRITIRGIPVARGKGAP